MGYKSLLGEKGQGEKLINYPVLSPLKQCIFFLLIFLNWNIIGIQSYIGFRGTTLMYQCFVMVETGNTCDKKHKWQTHLSTAG